MKKVIITVAQTGAFHGKELNPNIPTQPDEIAASAYDCYNAGASIVHVHTRDKNDRSSCDTDTFAEINGKIRSKCNIILQNSTAPPTKPGSVADEGLAALFLSPDVRPEMCSLDCSLITTSWGDLTWIYMWTRDWIMKTAKRMRELNIKPELEIFNIETLEDVFDIYQPAGILDDPISLSFVMGMNKISQGAISYSEQNLDFMISKLPKDQNVNFSTISIGAKTHLTGVVQTLLKGGNVRVGFEDNVYYTKGELAKSNAQMVERVVRIIHELGMEVATPDEARAILKLKKM